MGRLILYFLIINYQLTYCWRKTQMQSKYMWQHRLHSISSPHNIHQFYSQRNSVLTLRANRCVLVLGGRWLAIAAVASWVRDLNKLYSQSFSPRGKSERNQPPRDDMTWHYYITVQVVSKIIANGKLLKSATKCFLGCFTKSLDETSQFPPPRRFFGCHLEGLSGHLSQWRVAENQICNGQMLYLLLLQNWGMKAKRTCLHFAKDV